MEVKVSENEMKEKHSSEKSVCMWGRGNYSKYYLLNLINIINVS